MSFLEDKFPAPRQILEWLELQYQFGADSVAMYVYYIPNLLQTALENYAKATKNRLKLVRHIQMSFLFLSYLTMLRRPI